MRKFFISLFVLGMVGCGGGSDAVDGGSSTADAGAGEADAGGETPDGGENSLVARGDYLVNHAADCVGCHGDSEDNFLGGVECFFDVLPEVEGMGCVHTRNLTNDPTGLMNRTDDEIKDMFLNGVRPNGEALFSFMPYYLFHNMTDDDADAIVAYLRTVPAIDHQVPNNEPPFDERLPTPTEPLDLADAPEPDPSYPELESAQRGRYLAVNIGTCIECHTPRAEDPTGFPLDLTRAFQGGEGFDLPEPFGTVYSANITPDPTTGVGSYTVEEIVTILKEGTDVEGHGICPPMPAGPMAAFGGLTDEDATDLANFLLSITPVEAEEPGQCIFPGT